MNEKKNSAYNPKILAVANVVLWSFFTPVVKVISVKSQFLFVTLCFVFTFLTFLTVLLMKQKKELIRQIRHVNPRFFFFGLFGYFIYYIGLIQCFREFSSTSGTSVLIAVGRRWALLTPNPVRAAMT